MQVIFIHHSCFLIEVDDAVLIFDYFDGEHVEGYSFKGRIPQYAPDTKIYLFASHSHRDHYDMETLRWAEKYDNIHYIFSKDIRISPNFLKKHGINPLVRQKVTFVQPNKKYEVDDVSVTTLRSTDAGVAFYVSMNGVNILHCGDLNDWQFEGAGDLINGRMRKNFRHEINKISDKPVNIAFVPMDPRLENHQFEAIDYILKNTDAEFVFPMHMWQDYSGIEEYKRRISKIGMADRVREIKRENQVFTFGD